MLHEKFLTSPLINRQLFPNSRLFLRRTLIKYYRFLKIKFHWYFLRITVGLKNHMALSAYPYCTKLTLLLIKCEVSYNVYMQNTFRIAKKIHSEMSSSYLYLYCPLLSTSILCINTTQSWYAMYLMTRHFVYIYAHACI